MSYPLNFQLPVITTGANFDNNNYQKSQESSGSLFEDYASSNPAQTFGYKNAISAEIGEEFDNSLKEQGIIGTIGDSIKNLFNTKNCSDNIQKEINSLNENSSEEEIQAVRDKIKKYNSNQDTIVKTVGTTGSFLAGAAAGAKAGALVGTAIFPGAGTAVGAVLGVLAGAAAGAAANITINQVENMTDKVEGNSWQNDKNLLKEAGEGAFAGGSAVATAGITAAASKAVGAKIGLETVEIGSKSAMVALAEDGTAKVGETVAKNAFAQAIGSGTAATAVADTQYALETALDKDKEFSLTDLATTSATSFALGGATGAITGSISGYKGASQYNKIPEVQEAASAYTIAAQRDAQYNIRHIQTAEEVGELAEQEIGNMKYRVATAGYSAAPEGYEESTKEFLSKFQARLGSQDTAFVTSPTADKGSIDAITTEVAGLEDGKIFYTTAEGYVKYINPENFPETIDTDAYSQIAKHVLPDGSSYSAATAKASNSFVVTGGRNASVSDFKNAIAEGNRAVILDNSSIDTPAWGEAKGRVENASKYINEQLQAFFAGEELPYPEVEGFTREFMTENSFELKHLVETVSTDGSSESIQNAAKQAASFIKTGLQGCNKSYIERMLTDEHVPLSIVRPLAKESGYFTPQELLAWGIK